MSIETVNVGSTPNDGTGDTARAAFTKINENFTAPENAASKVVATTAQAIAGTAGVLPDAEGVKAHVDSRVTQSETDTTEGRLLKVGDFGLGGVGYSANTTADLDGLKSGFLRSNQASIFGSYYAGVMMGYGTGPSAQKRYAALAVVNFVNVPVVTIRTEFDGIVRSVSLRHTGNTTVDGNGFIKQASPIVQLHSDHIIKNGDFEADFERVDTGHYLIKNTLGFAQSGWWIETPKDANGNIKVFVEYEDNGGEITIKTYEPDYNTGRATAGEPADIPEGRWIDLRLHELPPEQDDLQTDTMPQTD